MEYNTFVKLIRNLDLYFYSILDLLLNVLVIESGNEVQPRNTFWPIRVTESGIVIDDNISQPPNAYDFIMVTELGMLIVVNEVQPANAPYLILVTELGMLIDVMKYNQRMYCALC